jgi:uncharacterized protein YjiS (DUF1127 family)
LKDAWVSKAAFTCRPSGPRPIAVSAGWPARAFLVAAIRWIIREWRRAAAIRELSRLDDRLLLDMGIERHTIDEAVDALLEMERREQ